MPLSVILFDLDETLFDHLHASRSALAALQKLHPDLARVPVQDLTDQAYLILERTHERVLRGELTVQAARVERVRQLFAAFGAELDEPDYQEASATYVHVYRRSRQAVAGAREMLDRLGAEYTIGIVTNNFRQEQESKLADCGLTDAIDFMITSEETGIPKPSSAIFAAALELGGAEPAEAVMVGDSWSVDIVGALEAGIRPVWFNRHGRTAPSNISVAQVRSYEPLERAVQVITGRD